MQSASDRLDLGRRWRPVLLAYFLRRVRNHAEAEDLTQELIAKLLGRGRGRGRGGGGGDFDSAEAYILQMASNLLADRARRQMLAVYDVTRSDFDVCARRRRRAASADQLQAVHFHPGFSSSVGTIALGASGGGKVVPARGR